MMLISNKYEIGAMVYLKTDIDQLQRMVTSIIVRPHIIVYELSCGSTASEHYDFEITDEENVLIKTT